MFMLHQLFLLNCCILYQFLWQFNHIKLLRPFLYLCQYLTRSRTNFPSLFQAFVITLSVTIYHLDNEKTFNGIASVRRGLLLLSTSLVSLQLPLKLSSLETQFYYLSFLCRFGVKIVNRCHIQEDNKEKKIVINLEAAS